MQREAELRLKVATAKNQSVCFTIVFNRFAEAHGDSDVS